jgi:hypothetical protein
MATTYKILGQTDVTADTDTTLYTVPSLTSAVVSSVVVCNTGTAERTFRIAIRNATLANKHYQYKDLPIPANDTFVLTIGATMEAGAIITVRANHAEVVFSAFGSEIS